VIVFSGDERVLHCSKCLRDAADITDKSTPLLLYFTIFIFVIRTTISTREAPRECIGRALDNRITPT
jgi:hypothetical protein